MFMVLLYSKYSHIFSTQNLTQIHKNMAKYNINDCLVSSQYKCCQFSDVKYTM